MGVRDDTAKIVEFNPFFGELTFGVALFGWCGDRSLLYGEEAGVVMRVLGEGALAHQVEDNLLS